MNRNRIYAMSGGAVAAMAVAVGLFFYLQPLPNQGVPPLPANARVFNNWALVGCQPGGRCALLRRAVNRQTGTIVMQMTIVRAQNGSAVMAVTLPPNVLIASGLTITPMGGTAAKGTIRLCRPQACTAAVAVTEMLAQEMAATDATALEFVAANGRNIRMNVNTRGFADGFAAWQKAAPAPAVVAHPVAPAGTATAPARAQTATKATKAVPAPVAAEK